MSGRKDLSTPISAYLPLSVTPLEQFRELTPFSLSLGPRVFSQPYDVQLGTTKYSETAYTLPH